MNYWLNIRLVIALVLIFSTSCTIEKRVFNRGYHIEFRSRYRHETVSEEISVSHSDQSIAENGEDIVLTSTTDSIRPQQGLVVAQVPDTLTEPKDSAGVKLSKPYDKQRKKEVLTGIGIPMGMFAIASGIILYLSFTDLIFFFVFLGVGGIFLFLLVLFLVFLIRKPDGRRAEMKSADRRLSKAQRLGIISAIIFVLVIVGCVIAPLLDD